MRIQKERYVYQLDDLLSMSGLPFKVTVPIMVAIAKEAARIHSYARGAERVWEHHSVAAYAALVCEAIDFIGAAMLAGNRPRAEATTVGAGIQVQPQDDETQRRRAVPRV